MMTPVKEPRNGTRATMGVVPRPLHQTSLCRRRSVVSPFFVGSEVFLWASAYRFIVTRPACYVKHFAAENVNGGEAAVAGQGWRECAVWVGGEGCEERVAARPIR